MPEPSSLKNRIELEGEWDLTRKEELKVLLDSLATDIGATIDLRRVTYVDSTFLGLLAGLLQRFGTVPVTLVGPNPNLKRVFGLIRFDQLFQVIDDE